MRALSWRQRDAMISIRNFVSEEFNCFTKFKWRLHQVPKHIKITPRTLSSQQPFDLIRKFCNRRLKVFQSEYFYVALRANSNQYIHKQTGSWLHYSLVPRSLRIPCSNHATHITTSTWFHFSILKLFKLWKSLHLLCSLSSSESRSSFFIVTSNGQFLECRSRTFDRKVGVSANTVTLNWKLEFSKCATVRLALTVFKAEIY